MIRRLLVLTGCFLAASVYAIHAMEAEVVPIRQPLSEMPGRLETWQGREAARLTDQELAVLGVDDYLNRVYVSEGKFVSLYVGYYQSQRQGDTIHSPLNCIPGSGWQPIETTKLAIAVPGRTSPVTVNHVVIEKGADRQVVLYWYQSHGRIVASEYWSKIFMVVDAIRVNRSDAALVRVVSPALSGEGLPAATERATRFVHSIFPYLERHLPS